MTLFLVLLTRGIRSFERRGSIPHGLARLLDPRVLIDLVRSTKLPPPSALLGFPLAASRRYSRARKSVGKITELPNFPN